MAATPLMKQYYEIKEKYPDALLLFQVGDFYETFDKDAISCSRALDIVLTKRSNGAASKVDLAGFPHHSLNNYLPKLIKAGFRVAICNQLEDPKKTKTLVKRGVVELVTPGTTLNDQVVEKNSNHFLASLEFGKNKIGLALLDLSTGEFLLAEEDQASQILSLLEAFNTKEILFQKQKKQEAEDFLKNKFYTYTLDDWAFDYDSSYEKLTSHFGTHSLKGFGLEGLREGIKAAGAILSYLSYNHHTKLDHIKSIKRIEKEKYLWMDDFTFKSLEILSSIQVGGKSLADILDQTITSMGSRLLKRWLSFPLKNIEAINNRQQWVKEFLEHQEIHAKTLELLKKIADVERLISKIVTFRIQPSEVNALLKSLKAIEKLKDIFALSNCDLFRQESTKICNFSLLIEKIEKTLIDEISFSTKENFIKSRVSTKLDEFKKLLFHSKEHLENLCNQEKIQTGISSLKIDFNQVFGYYIEVRHTHKSKVPSSWIRKQTLTGAERYITSELKEYENKILGAEREIYILEKEIFEQLLEFVSTYIEKLQSTSQFIAKIDILSSFALVAEQNKYACPELNDSLDLYIKEGRHPMIEKKLSFGQAYVPNDLRLDKDQQILILTGPNMAGKSAFLRQSALIILMAQIGSYVPATKAQIGIIDKIFSRVGASDNISQGESTFMVEMNETATIVNNLSRRSFLILDEIGRGTSTYDGLSIAWSIAEFLHKSKHRPKTLFATHYHELAKMEESFDRVKNYFFSIKETEGHIVFLRKLQRGASTRSFGLHVAKLAGIPEEIILSAFAMLTNLEENAKNSSKKSNHLAKIQETEIKKEGYKTQKENYFSNQLELFEKKETQLQNLAKEISRLKLNEMTPLGALIKLESLQKKLKEKFENS